TDDLVVTGGGRTRYIARGEGDRRPDREFVLQRPLLLVERRRKAHGPRHPGRLFLSMSSIACAGAARPADWRMANARFCRIFSRMSGSRPILAQDVVCYHTGTFPLPEGGWFAGGSASRGKRPTWTENAPTWRRPEVIADLPLQGRQDRARVECDRQSAGSL